MSFIGRRYVSSSCYKQHLTPLEWYSYTDAYPVRYKILKDYIKEQSRNGDPPTSSGFDVLPPDFPCHWPERKYLCLVHEVVPRTWFQIGQMLRFLIDNRHLKPYTHLHFTNRTYWDIPDALLCDYFWSEIRQVLAIREQLFCSDKDG